MADDQRDDEGRDAPDESQQAPPQPDTGSGTDESVGVDVDVTAPREGEGQDETGSEPSN